jgi:glycosyltransferase involved in cell wall biosynthesis
MSDRILLLSWTVPPETTGSAFVVGNLAQQFSRNEMIIAGERPYRRPPMLWKDDWPEIVYLIKGWPQMRRGARWWRWIQFPLLFVRCLRLVKKHRCKSIVVVFPNWEFLLVAYLTAVLTAAKLYPYFHNTYVEQCRQGSLHRRFAQWFQSRLFARAEHIFIISEGLLELFRERYGGLKCSALLHSFNETLPEFKPLPQAGRPLRLIIFGNINESCREATVRVCSAISQEREAELTILSGTAREYLRQLGILRNGVKYETVPHDLIVKRLGEADLVVLPHGFSGNCPPEEYNTIFPTRTIEYLICGRPILAHCPPNCYLTRFLEQHGCALIVSEPHVRAVVAAIKRLCADASLRSALVRNALRTAEMFHAPRVAATFRSLLKTN